jgi:energy-coupling factor transporter ATP-binding protein EcfA2
MKYATHLSDFAKTFEPQALEAGSEFYYEHTMPIRMGDQNESPINDLYDACTSENMNNTHLLMGHSGCGKSTELKKLRKRLEDNGHIVSNVDCRNEADMFSINHIDILILLGKYICQMAEEAGCDIEHDLKERIMNYWNETSIIETIQSDHNSTAGLGIRSFFINLSTELKYASGTREEIRKRVERNPAQWIGYITEISDMITHRCNGKQPVIIFEELDKLDQFIIEKEKIWDIFNSPLSKTPFPVIYTFPISLSYVDKFAALEASYQEKQHLPMIKIRDIHRIPYQPGIDAIKGIVEKRADLSLFAEDSLDILIKKTGGSLRTLFECITKAATRATRRSSTYIQNEDAERALVHLRTSLTRRIETRDNDLLRDIYQGAKNKEQIKDKEKLLSMIRGQIVLEYNGDRWHDLHPLIEDFLLKYDDLGDLD